MTMFREEILAPFVGLAIPGTMWIRPSQNTTPFLSSRNMPESTYKRLAALLQQCWKFTG